VFVRLVVGVVEVEVEAGQSDDPGDNGDRQGLPDCFVLLQLLLPRLADIGGVRVLGHRRLVRSEPPLWSSTNGAEVVVGQLLKRGPVVVDVPAQQMRGNR